MIDGVDSLKKSNRLDKDVDIQELACETPNCTGAEIAGVVKNQRSSSFHV